MLHTAIQVRDGQMTVSHTQDCDPIAEYAKSAHNEGRHGTSEMKHVARLPEVFVTDYINKHNITLGEFLKNREHIRRMCSDPALAHFRIWKGAL